MSGLFPAFCRLVSYEAKPTLQNIRAPPGSSALPSQASSLPSAALLIMKQRRHYKLWEFVLEAGKLLSKDDIFNYMLMGLPGSSAPANQAFSCVLLLLNVPIKCYILVEELIMSHDGSESVFFDNAYANLSPSRWQLRTLTLSFFVGGGRDKNSHGPAVPPVDTSGPESTVSAKYQLWKSGLQCCGSGMFIPDPIFFSSQIPDV